MTCDDVRDQAAGFVLGALTPEEEQAVREHLATCPEAHEEFAELGGVVPALAASVEPVEPSPALRARIMTAAAADLAARGVEPTVGAAQSGSTQPTAAMTPAVPAAPVAAEVVLFPAAPGRARIPRLAWVAGIAAVLIVAALGAWNVQLRSQLSDAQAYQQRVDQVLAIARSPGGVVAVLASPSGGGQDGLVAIGADGQAAMVVKGLPATTGTQVYEVWVIVPSSAPKPVGALSQSGAIAFMAGSPGPVPAGSTVALTKEPGPDPTAPTSDILVKGVVGPSS